MSRLLLLTDDPIAQAAQAAGTIPPSPARVYVKDHGVTVNPDGTQTIDEAVRKNVALAPKYPATFAADLRRARMVWFEGCDFLADSPNTADVVYEFAKELMHRGIGGVAESTWLCNVEHYQQPRRWREWRSFARNFVEPLTGLGIAKVGCFTAINVGPETEQNDWHAWEEVPVPVLHLYDIHIARLTQQRIADTMALNRTAWVLIRENDPRVAGLVAMARNRKMPVLLWDAWVETAGGGKRKMTPAERTAQNTATAALFAAHRQAGGR